MYCADVGQVTTMTEYSARLTDRTVRRLLTAGDSCGLSAGGVRGGRPDHQGRQLRVARFRGPAAVHAALHPRRQHLSRLHQRHQPRHGLRPQRSQQQRRLRLHHRRLRIPLHRRPVPQRQVHLRRPLRQVDVGRDRDAGGQRRLQPEPPHVQLLQELADPLRRRRWEQPAVAGLHLLLRRGQRQGRVPAHQQGRVPGGGPRRVRLRVPRQELGAERVVVDAAGGAELGGQGARSGGVGGAAGGRAASLAERLSVHDNCFFELRVICGRRDGMYDNCMCSS